MVNFWNKLHFPDFLYNEGNQKFDDASLVLEETPKVITIGIVNIVENKESLSWTVFVINSGWFSSYVDSFLVDVLIGKPKMSQEDHVYLLFQIFSCIY